MLSTERFHTLCAAARSLCLCSPRGGSAAQAAGLGEPSGAPPTLELSAHHSHRLSSDARLCACVRAQVRPNMARERAMVPSRRAPSPRSPPRPFSPSAASPPPAATAQVRYAQREKIEPVHACTPPNRRVRRPPPPPLPPRCPALASPHALPNPPCLRHVRSRYTPPTRHRRAANRATIGRPERAAAAVAALAGRCSRAQAAVEGGSVHRGWGAVREAAGTAVDGRGVVVGSRCRALTLVPVWGAGRGREIATGRPRRRLRGGSTWTGAGLGVVPGRARAGWGSVETSQGPQWSLPRANMRACDVRNLGDTYEIVSPVGVIGSGPRVFQRVFQLLPEVPSAKNRTENDVRVGP